MLSVRQKQKRTASKNRVDASGASSPKPDPTFETIPQAFRYRSTGSNVLSAFCSSGLLVAMG